MDLMQFQVLRDDEHLGIPAYELLTVDLRNSRMWTRDRILFANTGYLAGMLTDGSLLYLTPQQILLEQIPTPDFPIRLVS